MAYIDFAGRGPDDRGSGRTTAVDRGSLAAAECSGNTQCASEEGNDKAASLRNVTLAVNDKCFNADCESGVEELVPPQSSTMCSARTHVRRPPGSRA